jgi:hypothetical protein
MTTEIKAVVYKTSQLKATKEFFESKLEIAIEESSITHFVIHSKGIRILFVESNDHFEVELYVRKRLNTSAKNKLTLHPIEKNSSLSISEDPNSIKIIISEISGNVKIQS